MVSQYNYHVSTLISYSGITESGIRFDWLDPNRFAFGILFEIAQNKQDATDHGGSALIFHPVSPQVVSWRAFRDLVAAELQSQTGKYVEIVSLRTWISRVRRTSTLQHEAMLPIKILGRYFERIQQPNHLTFTTTC